MKTIQLKTNIMCSACLEKVTPAMNEKAGAGNWTVELTSPAKILTVNSDTLNAGDIIKAVETAGYKAVELS